MSYLVQLTISHTIVYSLYHNVHIILYCIKYAEKVYAFFYQLYCNFYSKVLVKYEKISEHDQLVFKKILICDATTHWCMKS